MIGWIIANSLALIGMVFYAGQTYNRLRSLEYRMKESELRHEAAGPQAIAIGILTVKIESLKDSMDSMRKNVHDLRNQLMATGQIS